MIRSAEFSSGGRFRYVLVRGWGTDPPLPGFGPRAPRVCNFIMLNPSTATAEQDDPTVRRCIGFARRWGYQRLVVTNLFAWRSTDPAILRTIRDPVGPVNVRIIAREAEAADLVVCAWGVHGELRGTGEATAKRLRRRGVRLHHLGLTRAGHPRHPLYLPMKTEPMEWDE